MIDRYKLTAESVQQAVDFVKGSRQSKGFDDLRIAQLMENQGWDKSFVASLLGEVDREMSKRSADDILVDLRERYDLTKQSMDQLVAFIRKAHKENLSSDDLHRMLVNAGWEKGLVDEIMRLDIR